MQSFMEFPFADRQVDHRNRGDCQRLQRLQRQKGVERDRCCKEVRFVSDEFPH